MTNLKAMLFVVLVFGFLAFAVPLGPGSVRADAPSRVYFETPTKCCISPGPSATVSFRVLMDLSSGERINGYDVRIDYNNVNTTSSRVLDALNIDNSGNVFAGQGNVLANCVDGVAVIAGGCAVGPDADLTTIGQVHFAEVSQSILNGPVSNVLLFTVNFSVNGTGYSLLTMNKGNLLNPGPDTFPNPHIVQAVTQAGVFGNYGIVPFFDYVASPPPSVLPGQFVPFDNRQGFNGSSSVLLTDPSFGLTPGDYSWNFGDGTPLDTQSGSIASHQFLASGNFTVKLTVTIPSDGSSWSLERVVHVYPNLGTLQITLKNLIGTTFGFGTARVLIYNSSLTMVPFGNRTVNAVGGVTFVGLLPGIYLARFSGSAVSSTGTIECPEGSPPEPRGCNFVAYAGWTDFQTVYVPQVAPVVGTNDTATIVYLAVIFGGVVVVATILLLQRRSRRNRAARRKTR